MRRLIAAGTVCALLFALAWRTQPAFANEDPDPKTTQKLESNAKKDLTRIGKEFAKGVKSDGAVATRGVNELGKAAKSGKRIAELSGIPSTPGVKVSPDQLRGLLQELLDLTTEFHTKTLQRLEAAYAQAGSSSAVSSFGASPSPRAVAGTDGVFDAFPDSCARSWEATNAKLVKAIRKVQAALADQGYQFTFVDCVPPKLNAPGADSVLAGPSFLFGGGDTDGDVFGAVARATGFGALPSGSRIALAVEGGIGPSLGDVRSDFPVTFYSHVDASDYRGPAQPTQQLSQRTWSTELPRNEPVYLTFISQPDPSDAFARRYNPALRVPVPGPCFPVIQIDVRNTFDAIPGTTNSTVAITLPTGNKTFNSNKSLAQKTAEGFIDCILMLAGAKQDGAPKVARLDGSLFPCGTGPNGFTVCPVIPAADPGGDLLVIGTAYAEDIPLNDPVNLLQYGFVFDQDGNPANNYVPIPQFSGDYYRDTDKWYSVEYSPSNGWELKVTDARNGGFLPVASAARAIINGNSITLAVPRSEFAVPAPAFRVSSFRHTGDYGQNPPFDWTADYDPEPGQPLRPFPTR